MAIITLADVDELELATEILELTSEELELVIAELDPVVAIDEPLLILELATASLDEIELPRALLVEKGALLAGLEFETLELELGVLLAALVGLLLTAGAELLAAGCVGEFPPPPQAVSNRLNVRDETRLRWRMVTPLLLY